MANVWIDDAVMQALANLLRETNGTDTKYFPDEMEPAFRAALAAGGGGSGGGGTVIEPVLTALEVVQNGVYVPGEGVDGFSSVTVNVPATSLEHGVVVNATDANGNWTDITIYGAVPANMYKSNTYLQKVTIADNVTTIGAHAFDACTKLTNVVIGSGVKTIGEYAFYGCKVLKSVSFPAGLTAINQYAFRNCNALTAVSFPEGLKTIANDTFNDCKALTSLTIPASVTSIGNYAFQNCTGITELYWNPPAMATAASSYYPPFKGCTAISRVVFADNVTHIPSYFLSGVVAPLTDMVFPDGLTYIGVEAFNGSSIKTATIPAGVTSVGNRAFYKCTSLTSVHWNARSSTAGGSSYPSFEGCTALAEFVIDEGVTSIPAYLLAGAGVQSLTIPAGVKSVGNRAFYNCKSLTTVHWNATSIASVGGTSYPIFAGCTVLTDFIIGDNVTTLPAYLLRDCTGIVNVVIPDGVTTIGTQAFYNCTKLVTVQVGESADCAIATIGANAFYASSITDITIYAVADTVSGSPWGATNATVTWLLA